MIQEFESRYGISIHKVIDEERLATWFQPLLAVSRHAILGLEALARGVAPNGEFIPPADLFLAAERENRGLDLDRLCRRKAFEAFRALHAEDNTRILFLNVDIGVIGEGAKVANSIMHLAEEAGVTPKSVVIEIIESKVENSDLLVDFVKRYRKSGFLLALDDIGKGHSNMDRIPLLKPDLLKVDMSFIQGIDREYHKQEVVKSFVNLSRQIGALVVAEGIEHEAEALTTLELGIDVLQGFYFARPAPHPALADPSLFARLQNVSQAFKRYKRDLIEKTRKQRKAFDTLLDRVIREVAESSGHDGFDEALTRVLSSDERLECAYVLSPDGIQVSNTICNERLLTRSRRAVFQPASKGADQSLKDYYLLVNDGLKRYVSPSYISLASGNLCTTLSAPFSTEKGASYIICLDIAQ